MTDFLSLISAIPSLISDFSGSTSAPYLKQQQQIAGQQGQISQALTQGAGNPLYNQTYNQYKQQNANTMASQIAEAQGQNRMNANLGRTPLFSNERGSENIFRTLMQQQQNGGVQADQQARQALQQAGGANLQSMAGYNSLSNYGKAANTQQQSGFDSIQNLLRGFGVGQQPQQTQPVQQVGGNFTNLANSTQQNPYAAFIQPPSTGSMGAGNYTQQQQPQQNYFNQLWGGGQSGY